MKDLTTGPVSKHLMQTTGYMLVVMVFQTLYFLVDLYWVGRLGKESVAAVGIAGNLMFLVLAMTQMLGVGTTALISHAVGAGDQRRARHVFHQGLALSVVVGAAYLALMLALRLPYAASLGADPVTIDLAERYLLWFIPAMAIQFPMVTMGAALRGTGNFKPGMIVQMITVLFNMALAPLLIFGVWGFPRIGVAGAAIASLVAVVVGTLWLSTWFVKEDSFLRFAGRDWKPELALWRRIINIGLPAGAEFGLVGLYVIFVYAISRPFGTSAQAGFGIAMRIVQAGFMPVVALGFAVAPVAGQNFGARRADRVREAFRIGVTWAAGAMLLFALACHIAPTAMIRIFSQDAQVVASGDEYLRIVSWNYVASGVVFVVASTFQALGNTLPSLFASLVRVLLVIVPTLLLQHVPGFRLTWVWLLAVAAVTVQVVLALLLLRREMRIKLNFPPAPAADPTPAEVAEAATATAASEPAPA